MMTMQGRRRTNQKWVCMFRDMWLNGKTVHIYERDSGFSAQLETTGGKVLGKYDMTDRDELETRFGGRGNAAGQLANAIDFIDGRKG